MGYDSTTQMQIELERLVSSRTGWRIRNLTIEMAAERVILRGLAPSYHVKQLAQHGVRDLLPDIHLENTIKVDRVTEYGSVA